MGKNSSPAIKFDEAYIRDLEQALSLERFARYLAWAQGSRPGAVELYTLNTQLSESLYTPLQMLEIALRNRIHAVLSTVSHERWYEEPRYQLSKSQAEQVAKAKSDVGYDGKMVTPGRVVAALTFGYWTAFFNTSYEELWRHSLRRIVMVAPTKPLTRKDFSSRLTPIRRLRNRIAHHEPILGANLPGLFDDMMLITQWLSPAAAAWCTAQCRFGALYPPGGIVLSDINANPGVAP